MDERENSLTELTDAARRVGSTVNEHVNSVIELAERRAEEIRRSAELDAEATRREAVESARRVFERINALEVPLGGLVETLRLEVATVERELEGHVDAEVAAIAGAPEDGQGEPLEGDGTAVLAPDAEASPDLTPSKPKPGRGSQRREKSRQERSTPGEEGPREEPTSVEEGPREEPAPSGGKPRDEPAPSGEGAPSEESSEDRPEGEEADAWLTEPQGPAQQSEPAPSAPIPTPVSVGEAEELEREEHPPIVVSPSPVAEPPERNGGAGAAGRVRGFFSWRGSGKFSRFRSEAVSRFPSAGKSDAFITTEGHCAVCQTAFMAGSEEELRLSDWNVNGDVGLCPDCQADRWQLPEGARLPFRRGGA